MYKMDYSNDNNQCAALSAEQFAQIPYTSSEQKKHTKETKANKKKYEKNNNLGNASDVCLSENLIHHIHIEMKKQS